MSRFAPTMPRDEIIANVTAGVIVGVVAIPLAIALAVAIGVPPIAGLYTAAFAGAVASILVAPASISPAPRRHWSPSSRMLSCNTASRRYRSSA